MQTRVIALLVQHMSTHNTLQSLIISGKKTVWGEITCEEL